MKIVAYSDILNESLKAKYSQNHFEVILRGQGNQIALIREQERRTSIIATLAKIAIELGFEVDASNIIAQTRLKACCSVIENEYAHLSLEMLRQAFLITHKTGADLESYGKDFNVSYVQRVLIAYDKYIKEGMKAAENKDKILQNKRKQRYQQMKEQELQEERKKELKTAYYKRVVKEIVYCYSRIYHANFSDSDILMVRTKWIDLLKECNLINYSKEEKLAMKDAAIALAHEDLLHDYSQSKFFSVSALMIDLENMREGKTRQGKVNAMWIRVAIKQFLLDCAMDGLSVKDFLDLISSNFEEKGWIDLGFANSIDVEDFEPETVEA